LKTQRSSFFIRLLLLLNIISITFLLLSYLAGYIPPDGNFWWLQIFGLIYGVLVSINIFFIILWIVLRNKIFLFSLIAVLIGIGRIFSVVQPGFFLTEKPVIKNNNSQIKVMSFNVRVFDLYNWSHKHELKDKILEFLKQETPDVVCFQEYFTSERYDYDYRMNDVLKMIIPAQYYYAEYTTTLHDDLDHWGIAAFSKYPIVNRQTVHFQPGGNALIYIDILAGSDTLRIINTHLESIRFRNEDYKFIENFATEKKEDELNNSLSILRKMKHAYMKRAQQVNILKNEITKSRYPVIVCGDFNDPPGSYTYNSLSEGLTDSFRESGKGFGKTYAGSFPSFRIDYILHSKQLKSFSYKTYHENLSDHYPISCLIEKN
jgi:endonuclease/exonuclease/phosphatase family metal-dependent hydrolase